MNTSIATLLGVVLLFGSCKAVANTNDYREYFTRIDGVENWFRVGSYTLEVNGIKTPIDIFYTDSDSRPDTKEIGWQVYPNSFAMYCVWIAADGNWTHSKVYGASRVTFHRVKTVESDNITLEFKPTFRVLLSIDDDVAEQWKRIEDINKPFTRIITLKEGVPTIIEP